jgi:hypothetical protein
MEAIENYTDIIERGVKRELPCKLTDEEELRIARQMVALKADLADREAAWDLKAKKHKQEVADTERAISKMERELHTGQQDRVVICNRVFQRNAAGGGDEVLIRLDPTHQLPGDTREVQRFPASASVMQRFLPFVGDANGTGSVLDDARAQQAAVTQRSAAPAAEDDVPGDDVPSGDGEAQTEASGDTAPEQRDTKPEKFDSALLADGKCALRFEGGNGCTLEVGHPGLHKSATHSWKARRPKVALAEADSDGDPVITKGDGTKRSVPKRGGDAEVTE